MTSIRPTEGAPKMATPISDANPTIARLDRAAAQIGLDLRESAVNRREFEGFGRVFSYKPGGKGIVRVESRIDGQLAAVVHRDLPGMLDLFARVNEDNNR